MADEGSLALFMASPKRMTLLLLFGNSSMLEWNYVMTSSVSSNTKLGKYHGPVPVISRHHIPHGPRLHTEKHACTKRDLFICQYILTTAPASSRTWIQLKSYGIRSSPHSLMQSTLTFHTSVRPEIRKFSQKGRLYKGIKKSYSDDLTSEIKTLHQSYWNYLNGVLTEGNARG